ncbi:hypothetical protein [Mycobacterium sp.]|uniref:hypothetical protein n=1 Tax=Mycobacterium sp. TaxID=1785 RepID=UPI002D8DF8AA|nr:hypothetical protein [Mycobacterium sp.]
MADVGTGCGWNGGSKIAVVSGVSTAEAVISGGGGSTVGSVVAIGAIGDGDEGLTEGST